MKLNVLLRIAMLLGVLFIFYLGVNYALEAQRDTSDAYPRFSTYRNDPQGFRVLFEALNRLPGVVAVRNQRQLSFMPLDQIGTLLLSDAVSSPDPAAVIERIEAFIDQGGRLVVAYSPLLAGSRPEAIDMEEWLATPLDEENGDDACEGEAEKATENHHESNATSQAHDDEEGEEAPERAPEDQLLNLVNVEERWDVALGVLPLRVEHDSSRADFERAQEATPQNVFATNNAAEGSLPWRSARYFEGDDAIWEVLYQYDSGEAAVIERRFGAGSIVLMGDSYPLSNESLAENPIAPFLAQLVGPHRRVIFDEWTKGVRDDPWMIDLIRRYRLDGVLVALVVIALLMVWRSAMPLPPRLSYERREQDTAHMQERRSPVGLPALIEKNVNHKDLPRVCFEEWRQTFQHDPRYDDKFREQLRQVLCHDGPETPVERYRAASLLMEERKHYRD